MSKVDLEVFKAICAVALGISSMAGVVGPTALLRCKRSAKGDGDSKALTPTSPHGTPRWLSLANCASAGLLIGVGLLHFLAEAIESAGHNGAKTALGFFIVGLFIPLFVDRVLLSILRGQSGPGHSHGITIEDGHHSHDGDPEGSSSSTSSSGGPPVKTNKVLLIAVLLAIHSVMEGLTLGIEKSIPSMRSAIFPMLIHKFFDGLILGVCVAKKDASFQHQSNKKGGASGTSCITGLKLLPKSALWWIFVTPMVMIGTAIFSSDSGEATAPVDPSHHLEGGIGLSVVVQGVGAGSFIYIALVEILPDEFGNASDALRKFSAVVLGAAIVLVLEGGGHHHHH